MWSGGCMGGRAVVRLWNGVLAGHRIWFKKTLERLQAGAMSSPRGSSGGTSGAAPGEAVADSLDGCRLAASLPLTASQTAATSHRTLAAALLAFGTPRHCVLSASDDNERRLRHRAAAVAAVKRLTPEYTLARARATTPDPTDLSISKRRWEASVQEWRDALRTVEL